MSTNEAAIHAVLGASGSGKSLYIKQTMKRARPGRIMVWDPQEEYGHLGQLVESTKEARGLLLKAGKRGKVAIVFRPTSDTKKVVKQFDAFCQLAYHAGNLFMVCEELSDVTQPAWAPAGWSMVSRKGRHKGLAVWGCSQRPAAIDKHFFGNASTVRCGRLNFDADVQTMANVLGVPQQEIRNLQSLEFIERDMKTGAVVRGRIEQKL